MLYKMINKDTEDVLFVADIYVGPAAIFCKKVVSIDMPRIQKEFDFSILNLDQNDIPYLISEFLEGRSKAPISYEYDEYALNILGLKHKSHLFGRMNDYSCAVGLLTGFSNEKDSYCGLPLKDELVSFIAYDANLCRKYLIRKDGTCF